VCFQKQSFSIFKGSPTAAILFTATTTGIKLNISGSADQRSANRLGQPAAVDFCYSNLLATVWENRLSAAPGASR
jgi:hypothetical protein